MVVIKKKLLFIFSIFYFISFNIYSSVIVDYETEEFIKKINKLILSVNDYNYEPNVIIILDDNINAFVNQNGQIYISSGLIKKSSSYIALLGVLAHEIGHIEKYHLVKRKESIQKLQSLNVISTLSIIAGSIMSQNQEVVQTLVANKFGINNFYINHSKEQEREADQYAIDTINKLNLSKEPLIKLLNTLENESLSKGISEEYHKFSTHPIYKQRYDIINESQNIGNYIDLELEKEFNFIKAKFIGYSSNDTKNFNKYLTEPFNDYANSIYLSKKGNLKESLKILNLLIEKNNKNFFLLETKADILLSYGYKKEAIKFYKKVYSKYPDNNYAQLIIFNNYEQFFNSIEDKSKFFNSNLNLLFNYPGYKILYLKYKNLSIKLNKTEWLTFFNIYEMRESLEKELYIDSLNKLIDNTNDRNLTKLLKIHLNL